MLVRAASALLATAALLTGCGPFADPADTGGAAHPAPVTTPGPVLYQKVTARMVAEGTATFTFSGQGGRETVAGSGSMRFQESGYDADVQLTMPDAGRVRAVLLPTASYLALPRAKGLPKSRPWLKVSARPRTAIGRRLDPVVDQLRASFDPAQSLGLLRAARKVADVGPATVEGVPTTHHHAVVNLRRATEFATGSVKEQYQSMRDAGVRRLEYDVWLDTSGLPRKFSTDIPTTAGLFSITGIYRNWGRKVRIEQPTAKQVFDADQLKG